MDRSTLTQRLSGIMVAVLIGMLPASLALAAEKATSAKSRTTVIDGIAAKVNQNIITISALRERLQATETPKEKYLTVLDKLIEENLIKTEIQARSLAATPGEIADAILQIQSQNGVTSDRELRARLQEQGVSYQEFRRSIVDQIEQSKFVNYVMGQRVPITDQDVENHYRKTYGKGKKEKVYSLSSILLKSMVKPGADKETMIKTIKRRLKDGAKFSKLAKEFSQSSSASSGGKLGDFKSSDLQPNFLAAVGDLSAGQTSEPVQTGSGTYLLHVDRITYAAPAKLEQLRQQIERDLTKIELERLFNIWVKQAKESAFIDIRIKDASEI